MVLRAAEAAETASPVVGFSLGLHPTAHTRCYIPSREAMTECTHLGICFAPAQANCLAQPLAAVDRAIAEFPAAARCMSLSQTGAKPFSIDSLGVTATTQWRG